MSDIGKCCLDRAPLGCEAPARETEPAAWWKRAVFYQIAPISFLDTDGDGRGDLNGIIARIDYLEWLGIGAVWLCPIYPSPFRDFGYDISDFCAIDPMYGTLADFDRLVERLHASGIRLLLDFVPNHTSDAHAWFRDSRSSRQSARRDWYVWADPGPDGGPPNNWLSRFGGSAWEWDAQSGQYYYHAFLKQQPDLNWRTPAMRATMADVLRFWLRRGVDGFRVDAAAVLIEDDLLRDDPPNPDFDPDELPPPERLRRVFTDGRRETMMYLAELRAVVDEFPDRVLAGEVQGKIDRIGRFYGTPERPCIHLPLNYALLDTAWDALSLQGTVDAFLNVVPPHGWPDWVIGGHDKRRIARRIGEPRSRLAALLLITLPGTPFFFAGDEIGMAGVDIPPGRVTDPFEKRVPGFGLDRDPERSPMRWSADEHGGFTSGRPWLPMGDDIGARNVEKFRADPTSLLNLYRSLIRLRAAEPAFTRGRYLAQRSRNDVFAFERAHDTATFLVAANLSAEPRRLDLSGKGDLVLSTHLDRRADATSGHVMLRGYEGVVIRQR